MTENFESWTAYDDWLIKNYAQFSIYKLDDDNGKISIEFCKKEDWPKIKEELMKTAK